jgi:dihydroflavonol-4-reductase
VTGASGFIGGHLAEELARRGDEVCCLVRKTSNIRWLEKLNVKCTEGELRAKESLRNAVRGMDYVFHLAAVINAPDWETYYNVNTKGTQNLIEACLEKAPEIRKFVFVSSIAACGPSEPGRRLNEDDPCRPVSDYGRSKHLAEQIVLGYKDRLPVSIIRPPNVLGPRQKELFESIKLIRKRIMPLIGTGKPQTSLASVEDVVKAVLLVAEQEQSRGRVYFVTDGRDYAWLEIAGAIAEFMGIKKFILKVPYGLQYFVAFLSEIVGRFRGKAPLVSREYIVATRKYDWLYDSSKIENELGFRAELDIRTAIGRTIDWYREAGML